MQQRLGATQELKRGINKLQTPRLGDILQVENNLVDLGPLARLRVQHAPNEVVEVLELDVAGWNDVLAVDDAQLGAVLERMPVEAEQVEHAAHRPNVRAHVYRLVAVQVEHLGCAVHWGCLFGDLVFDEAAFVSRPAVVWCVHCHCGASEVAQFDLVIRRHQKVLQL